MWLRWVSSMIASYLRKTTTVMWKLLFNLAARTASIKSNSTKVEETDTRQLSLCNKLHVSRWNRSLVSVRVRLVRTASIQQYGQIEKRLRRAANRTSTPTKNFCVLLEITSTHEPSSWCHCWGTLHGKQKISYAHEDLSWWCSSTRQVLSLTQKLHT